MNSFSVREIVAALTDPVEWEARSLPERAELGREAHRNFIAPDDASVQREVSLRAEYISPTGEVITIRGRIDLVSKRSDQVIVTELKSVALPAYQFEALSELPERYLLQARIYAWLFYQNLPKATSKSDCLIRCTLDLVNLTDGSYCSYPIAWSPQEVEADLERFLEFKKERAARDFADAQRRRIIANELAWPYPDYRTGQRDVMGAVRQAWREECDLLLEAPPGFGKTIAVLFGTLQQTLSQGCRLFYATAKGGGQNPVRQSVQALREQGSQLRVLFLIARESLCPYELGCFSGEDCLLRRLEPNHPAVADTWPELDQRGIVTSIDLQEIGQKRGICPRTLAEAALDWADLTVGDYNFVFDPAAQLDYFHQPQIKEWYLLVDEAHNLVERVADNFSCELTRNQISSLINDLNEFAYRYEQLPAFSNLKDVLQDLLARLNQELEDHQEEKITLIDLNEDYWNRITADLGRAAAQLMLAAEGHLDPRTDALLRQIYYNLKYFTNLLNEDREAFPIFGNAERLSLGVKCLDPGLKTGEMFSKFRGAAVFSGTFSPLPLWQTALGFGARPTRSVAIEAERENKRRLVVLAPGVDTRFQVRPRSIKRAAEIISDFVRLQRGGYLIVFPSYEYIELALPQFELKEAEILVQQREMPYADRRRMRRALENVNQTTVALVVAGGQFTEAEDYPGDACVGVVVVGPCLPPPDYWREALRAYWDRRGEDGLTLAYYAPAMRRAVQAGGRLLRNETDRGVVLLLDDRFLRPEFFNLLPTAWQNDLHNTDSNWKEKVERFRHA
ncbi:MAG: helicase C-terminal domain-containing protein [Calditrichota bacterium]